MLAAIELHHLATCLNRGHSSALAELDGVLRVLRLRPALDVAEIFLAPEIALRERRPVVRWVRLRTDQCDSTGESTLACLYCAVSAPDTGTDDDEVLLFLLGRGPNYAKRSDSNRQAMQRGLDAIVNLELPQHLLDVLVDRVCRHAQPRGDLAVRQPEANLIQYLAFPSRKFLRSFPHEPKRYKPPWEAAIGETAYSLPRFAT